MSEVRNENCEAQLHFLLFYPINYVLQISYVRLQKVNSNQVFVSLHI